MYIDEASPPEQKKSQDSFINQATLAIESSGQGLWDWCLDKKEAHFSPGWKAMLGYKDQEILNIPETWLGRLHPEDLNPVNDAIEAHCKGITDSFSCEYRLRHRDGSYKWMGGRGKIHKTPEGKRFIGLHMDITTQKRFQEQFRQDALFDHLTGLANRVLFMERLHQTVKRAKREKDFKFALLFLDLDKLKKINDSMGHAAGDTVIKHFARCLAKVSREVDTVARLGGDEFTIIQPDIHHLKDVENFAKRILSETSHPFEIGDKTITPSVSIGIKTNLQGNMNSKDLLRDADLALYHSKSKKGDYYSVFEEKMRMSFQSHFQLETSLKSALSRKELHLFYQPVFNLKTRAIVGMEALMRWNHPHFGLISPLDFIPLAEESNVINELGYWALETSSKQLNHWIRSYGKARQLTMSVNVSGRQLDQSDFVEKLQKILQKCAFPTYLFQLELTESVLAKNPNVSKFQMYKLKDLGIKIALDDFGTGYSSLSLLHQYPFDCLKIDRGFISHIDINPRTQKTVKSIKNLADDMGYETIAEGIETAQEQIKLEELGFSQGQGFIFSRAVTAQEFEKFLK